MSAVEPLATPAPKKRPRRHLRPVAPATERVEKAKPAPVQPGVDLAGLSSQLAVLERDLRHTWSVMLELDAATAGRVSHAGRLLRQASVVLDDRSAIF